MAHPTLAEEIEDLLIHRIQRADPPARQSMFEEALNLYSRTTSVLALLNGQPVAFYHERSQRAFTLTGMPSDLRACRLVPIPRIRTLDRRLEDNGEAPPQHGRGPPPTSYSRYETSRHTASSRRSSSGDPGPSVFGWTRRRPSASGHDHGSSGHRRRDSHDHSRRAAAESYADRHNDRYGGSSSSHYSSAPRPDDGSYVFTETHSTFYTSTGVPTGSSSHYTYSHGRPDPSHFQTETRMPGGSSHGYPSGYSSGYSTDPRRPTTSSGPSGSSSSRYHTYVRTPGGFSDHHHHHHHHRRPSHSHNHSHNHHSSSDTRRPYNTHTRAPGGSGSSSSSSSSPPRHPQQGPPPHPPHPPANATEADVMEWQLKVPYGYYAIMGVDRGAGADEIKRAYKKLALAHHPDRHAGGGEENDEARRRFQAVGEANEWLADAARRGVYDGNGGLVPDGGGRRV